jgi:hypothetical protein
MLSFQKTDRNLRGGRLVKYKGRAESCAPTMLLASVSALALSFGLAHADVISTPQTTPQALGAGDHLITSTITIDATDYESAVSLPDLYAGTLTNQGTITIRNDDGDDLNGIGVDGDLLGSILNEGDISIEVGDGGAAEYYGIWVSDLVSEGALIESSGSISVTVTSADSPTLGGIVIEGDMDGTLRNSGLITVDLEDFSENEDGNDINVRGIWIEGDVGGLIENTDTISATASGSYDNFENYHVDGIYVSGALEEGAVVRNTGTIMVDGQIDGTGLLGVNGVRIKDDVFGAIENSGSISANLTAEGGDNKRPQVRGIYVEGDYYGTASLTNSGSITATANVDGTDAFAYGIVFDTSIEGNVTNTNSGTISATIEASGEATVYARGISSGNVLGTISNSGLITAKAVSDGDEAYAYALTGNAVSVNGVVENLGTLSAQATGVSSATAWGMYYGDIAGSVTNSGQIIAKAKAFGKNYEEGSDAWGIYVDNIAETGLVVNEGIIQVTADGESYATAYGIRARTVDGRLENSGTITVYAESSDTANRYPISYGIRTNSVGTTGVILNSGSIQSTAVAHGDVSLSATGIYFGNLEGRVENSGSITVKGQAEGNYAASFGLFGNGVTEGGSVINSGVIDVTSTSDEGTQWGADGITVNVIGDDTSSGSVINSGEITARGSSETGRGIARGIRVMSEITALGRLTNEGRVTAIATHEAYGINVKASPNTLDIAGVIENTGTVLAQAVSDASTVYAAGINLSKLDAGGVLSNSGTISAVAEASYSASAQGIAVPGDQTSGIAGRVENSGTITADAKSTNASGSAYATGLYTFRLYADGSVTNSGTILATAVGGEGKVVARAVQIDNLEGTFTNKGVIRAVSDDQRYAIKSGTGAGTLNLYTSGVIQGEIGVEDHDVNLISVANGSAYYVFEDEDAQTGTFNKIVDGGQPWFVQDEGGSNPIYATMGTTGLAANTLELGGVVGQTDGLAGAFAKMYGVANPQPEAEGGIVNSTMSVQNGFAKFGQVNWDRVTYSDSGLEQKVTVGSVLGGGVGTLQNGVGFGVMAGFVSTRASGSGPFDAMYDNKASGGMVQIGFAQQSGGAILDIGLHVGALSHENKRYVTTESGGETATASFDSVFYGVSAGAAVPMAMGNGLTITPSARISATQQRLGSYTETGASENAKVGARTATVTEAKVGIEVAKQMAGGKLSGTLEYLHRSSSGDASFDVSMFGTSASGSTLSRTDGFGKIGLAYEAVLGEGRSLDIAASANIGGSGIGGQTISATYSFDF